MGGRHQNFEDPITLTQYIRKNKVWSVRFFLNHPLINEKWYFPSEVAVVIYMVIWPWQIPLIVISYALTSTYLKLEVESLHCFSDYKMVRKNEDVLKNFTPPSVKYSQILFRFKTQIIRYFQNWHFWPNLAIWNFNFVIFDHIHLLVWV